MHCEPFDVPHLLARRKKKYIGVRAAAELIDLIVIAVGADVILAATGAANSDAGALLVLVLLPFYFTVLEAHSGQTIGKRLLAIRVVNSKGLRPSLCQAFVRSLVLPFETFGLLALIGIGSVTGTDKGQRIGDLLAATYVVQNDELQSLTSTESQLRSNETPGSRQVIPLSSDALDLAKSLIASAFKPNDTGLTIAADSSSPHGLVVQLDYIDTADDSWHYTTDGVTVSVPGTLTDQCAALQIGISDGKLVVESAT